MYLCACGCAVRMCLCSCGGQKSSVFSIALLVRHDLSLKLRVLFSQLYWNPPNPIDPPV